MNTEVTTDGEAFGEVLARWRCRRWMTKQALAAEMGFDRSYVSHVEAGRYRGSVDFVRKAEAALGAGGELWDTWQTGKIFSAEWNDDARAQGEADVRAANDQRDIVIAESRTAHALKTAADGTLAREGIRADEDRTRLLEELASLRDVLTQESQGRRDADQRAQEADACVQEAERARAAAVAELEQQRQAARETADDSPQRTTLRRNSRRLAVGAVSEEPTPTRACDENTNARR